MSEKIERTVLSTDPRTGARTVRERRRELGPLLDATYERTVVETDWGMVPGSITACFCCSCSYSDATGHVVDPDCRDHGFDGRRPCEEHGTPGAARDLSGGAMPGTVQQARKARG